MDAVTSKEVLSQAKRIVVKVGSALLIDKDTHALRQDWLASIATDVAALKAQGAEVIVVTSGAIALGREPLGLMGQELKLEEKQAAAAMGQGRLAHAYQDCFQSAGLNTAQVLLTLGDTEQRRAYLNARSTFDTLLKLGAIPVVNENDTVATQEIRFGDNDRLAARVAQMTSADALVLLSDVDGLYTSDLAHNTDAAHVPVVKALTADIEAMAGDTRPGHGTGGMVTKLMAAKVALGAGCHMAIAPGHAPHPIATMIDGGRCTWFLASAEPRTAYKQWIAGALSPTGSISIDAGALAALRDGKSLLPAGVTEVHGRFERGDAVLIAGPDGEDIGRGLVAYSSEDTQIIMGHRSDEIRALLGYAGRSSLIHRDDLVLDPARG